MKIYQEKVNESEQPFSKKSGYYKRVIDHGNSLEYILLFHKETGELYRFTLRFWLEDYEQEMGRVIEEMTAHELKNIRSQIAFQIKQARNDFRQYQSQF